MDILNVMDGIKTAVEEYGHKMEGAKIRVVFDEDSYNDDISEQDAAKIISGVEINGEALPNLKTAVCQFLKGNVYDDDLRDTVFDLMCDTAAWVKEMRYGGVLVTCDGVELTGLTDEEMSDVIREKIVSMIFPVFPWEHIVSQSATLTAFAAAAIVFDAKPIGFPVIWKNPVEIGDYEGVHGVAFLEKNGDLILELLDADGNPIVATIVPDMDGKREIFAWMYVNMKYDENPENYCGMIHETFLKIK